jgi:tRNA pseudouridine55 synthase
VTAIRTPATDPVPGPQHGGGVADRPAAWPSGLVIVDKPGGMTSHDVVARLRRIAHTRRVGHAGTLDPMATGVLVIGIEQATRLLGHLMLTEKTYAATIRLGQSTTTDDAEGEPSGGSPASGLARTAVDEEIARLTGPIQQVPSAVSAIKVNGQRAYKLTRAGETPELAARPVTVYEFTVTAVRTEGDFLDLDAVVRCSSGTYIRALARDLGAALGTGGHLTALRRTAVGPYTLDLACTLADLEGTAQPDGTQPDGTQPDGTQPDKTQPARTQPLTPLADAAAAAFPRLELTADEARRLAQGARLPLTDLAAAPVPGRPDGAPAAAFAPDGSLTALVTADHGQLRSLAVFAR